MQAILAKAAPAGQGCAKIHRPGGLARHLLAPIAVLLDWQQRLRERSALARMDDRLLKDIGLSRSQVECEVSKPFWRA